jgi:acyl transferase domain-containing protein/NAD(P)-dependent dehydrogenase (short-subunit alcohol dehydrogenase family)/acyl carrier protein
MSSESVPLAIVGIGCLFPKADGPGAFWANVKQGVDCVGPVPATHWSPDDYLDDNPKAPDMTYAARGAFLDPVDFNPLEFGISPVDLEATDTSQLLGLVAARQALNDAGYTPDRKFDRDRISVILGVTGTLELVIPLGARLGHPRWRKALAAAGVDKDTADRVVQDISDSYVPWQESSFPGLLGNVVAGRIANKLDLGGTNCVVDAACASSLSAIHLASLELAAGRCDVAVTGGVDTFNDIFMFMCFSKTPALSRTGDAKPFDADGDGTILGEGLGIVVLKRLADAERDGDRIYAVLKTIGSSSDGKGNAVYAPSASGQVRCLKNAYELAGVSPATIELIEAHGTGTKVGDSVEATALSQVFRESRADGTWCALGSVKSMIGHTKAAAGAAGLIKAALALYNKVLPPTLKVKSPVDPLAAKQSPLYVNTLRRPWLPRAEHPRRAGMSAFGFGGSNFHAVLEEHKPAKAAPDWDGRVQIVALSAKSSDELLRRLDDFKEPVPWPVFCRNAMDSRAAFRVEDPCRLLLVVDRNGDFAKLLNTAIAKLIAEPNAASWAIPEGAYFGHGVPAGTLAVLFPGQGSQSVGMLRDLACTFPEMLDSLAAADREWQREPRLSDVIYPQPAFQANVEVEQQRALRATDVVQPALGAVEYGALQVLQRFGIRANVFGGHSYGELAALCAAGAFDAATLHRLSRERGRVMASFAGQDAGSMLAAFAPLADIEKILRDDSIDVSIANRNAPTQCVLSGRSNEINRAEKSLHKRQVRCARLPVAAAFHSPLVASAREPFRAALESASFQSMKSTVFANRNGQPYPDDPATARNWLADQLAQSVEFVAQVENMALSGVRTFVEVGPGTVLTKLVQATLKSRVDIKDWDCLALDRANGKGSGILDLAHAVARVASRGHAVDLTVWEAGQTYPIRVARPGLTVPIVGANYVRPRESKPPSSSAKPIRAKPIAEQPVSTPPRKLMPEPLPKPAPDPTALSGALGLTQQSLLAFQRMQEETAKLHKQFLDNQQSALVTLQMLVAQQQALLSGQPIALPPMPVSQPVSVASTPPAVAPIIQLPESPSVVAPIIPLPPPPMPSRLVAPSPPPVSAKPQRDRSGILLSIVAEKTGYPADMLGLDMALDADLGIDSIKRVEILSAVQEKIPDAPAVKPEHLGTLHTLRDIVNFLGESGSVAPEAQAMDPPTTVAIEGPQAAAKTDGDVAGTLLAVVAEKTGYPADMLGLDMALDADLGIDSIKRVEILSALQEKIPDAPEVKPEHLGTLNTLRDIASFLGSSRAGPTISPVEEAPRPFDSALTPGFAESGRASGFSTVLDPAIKPEVVGGSSIETATTYLPAGSLKELEISIQETNIPTGTDRVVRSVIRPVPIDLEIARPRIRFNKFAPVWLIAEPSSFTARLSQQFDAAGCRPQFIPWNDSPFAYQPTDLAGLVMVAPDDSGPDDLPLRAFRWLKRAAPALAESAKAGGAFFATVTKLDGMFGFGTLDPNRDPVHGALAGLSKSAAHEWPQVACKAIDIDPAVLRHVPHVLVEEILTAGPIEVGLSAKGRSALELVDVPAVLPAGDPVLLTPGDVVVVSGGARGVTAEALMPLVRATRPKLVLLGRSTPADAEPEWLRPLKVEAEIKQAIIAHRDTPATPRVIGDECKRILASRDVRRNIDRFRTAGATVEYIQVDVQDFAALGTALADARQKFGPIAAIVHGAGILSDRKIEDLTEEQFQSVYATKVHGLQNLLTHSEDDPLRAIVLFSSSTGRFGRAGQIAYAAANEVLNKTAQRLNRLRPHCRTVAMNWGPWAGGMVTPALAKVFASEGIGLIPFTEGGETLFRELASSDRPAEVVVIARSAQAATTQPKTQTNPSELQTVFERTVTLETHSVIKSHVIGNKGVVPFVLHLEWMAHAAMHGQPGLRFHGFDELRIFQGIHVDEATPAVLRVLSGKAIRKNNLFVVPVEIRGTRKDRDVIHSKAQIVLADRLPEGPFAEPLPTTGPFPYSPEEAYEFILFHGPDLRAFERIDGMSDRGAVAFAHSAPPPASWMDSPVRGSWIADPLSLDAAFQLLSVWSYQRHRAASLPCFAGKYRQFRRSFPSEGVLIAARITFDSGSTARADIDFIDGDGRLVARMTDAEHVIDTSLNEAFRRGRMHTPTGLSTHATRVGSLPH